MTLMELYALLSNSYGVQSWWPLYEKSDDAAFEVMVGAILTQNTAWKNVLKVYATIKNHTLSPEWIMSLSDPELSDLIRPSGYYNQKSARLRRIVEWYSGYSCDAERVKAVDLNTLRAELLAINGVGNETCDSIMLYAFDFPVFVIDAYTKRLLDNFGMLPTPNRYDDLRKMFETNIARDAELYKEFHALIVYHCANVCKKKPICKTCLLANGQSLQCSKGFQG